MPKARPQPSATISFRMYVLVVIAMRKNPETWLADFPAGEKNEIINGGPGLTFGQDNHALYNQLEALSIQNQMNEFMSSGKFTITIAIESTKDPDQNLSKVDNSSYSMMDDVLAAINDAGYGMKFTGGEGDKTSNADESEGFFNDGVWTLGLTGTASGGIIGVSGEFGITLDFRNGFQIGVYTTTEHALGADWSAGAILNYHKPLSNTSDFGVPTFEGWSETYNGAFLMVDGTYGGNANNKGLDPNNYSDYHTLYYSYGIGISVGSPVGFTRNKGYTWTSPAIGW